MLCIEKNPSKLTSNTHYLRLKNCSTFKYTSFKSTKIYASRTNQKFCRYRWFLWLFSTLWKIRSCSRYKFNTFYRLLLFVASDPKSKMSIYRLQICKVYHLMQVGMIGGMYVSKNWAAGSSPLNNTGSAPVISSNLHTHMTDFGYFEGE